MIRKRAVDCVVIAKLDRITRSVRDLGEQFQRYGVEFASVADNIDSTTAAGRLVLNVMASVAQWEREAIGERTAEALAHIRAQGGWAHRPVHRTRLPTRHRWQAGAGTQRTSGNPRHAGIASPRHRLRQDRPGTLGAGLHRPPRATAERQGGP